MLCPSCNNFRPANNAPCPWCNTPAAQANNAWSGQNAPFAANQEQASWGGPTPSGQLPFPGASWQDPAASGAQQLAFSASGTQPAASDNAFWSQTLSAPDGQGGQPAKQQSLVPYQPQPNPGAQSLMVMPNGFPTLSPNVQAVNSLLPALPDQEAAIYVPPMYTKPRPIIPRYRAISGLLSMLIVFALLCGGAGYLAQVTGKLAPLEKMLGFSSPPPISLSTQALKVPSAQQTAGPANNMIYSVGLGDSAQVPVYVNKFTVDQTIYLLCGINASQPGKITVKWYTNNNLYRESDKQVPDPQAHNLYKETIAYAVPAEGKIEVYWNDKLAVTAFFVVEPSAQ